VGPACWGLRRKRGEKKEGKKGGTDVPVTSFYFSKEGGGKKKKVQKKREGVRANPQLCLELTQAKPWGGGKEERGKKRKGKERGKDFAWSFRALFFFARKKEGGGGGGEKKGKEKKTDRESPHSCSRTVLETFRAQKGKRGKKCSEKKEKRKEKRGALGDGSRPQVIPTPRKGGHPGGERKKKGKKKRWGKKRKKRNTFLGSSGLPVFQINSKNILQEGERKGRKRSGRKEGEKRGEKKERTLTGRINWDSLEMPSGAFDSKEGRRGRGGRGKRSKKKRGKG